MTMYSKISLEKKHNIGWLYVVIHKVLGSFLSLFSASCYVCVNDSSVQGELVEDKTKSSTERGLILDSHLWLL